MHIRLFAALVASSLVLTLAGPSATGTECVLGPAPYANVPTIGGGQTQSSLSGGSYSQP